MKHLILATCIAFGISTSAASAQTLQQCADFANLYCVQTFPSCFEGRTYQQVTVNQSKVLSGNSLGMSGTVRFLDVFGLPKDNYFELVLTMTAYNTMEVKFAKLNEVFGSQYWEYCNNTIPMPDDQPTQLSTLSPAEKWKNQEQINRIVNQYNKVSWETSKVLMSNW